MNDSANDARAAEAWWRYAAAALAIVLVLGASIALRLYPTLTSPSLPKMLSLPVLSEYDGYYYIRYAKEYCNGTYVAGEIDSLRGAHNDIERPRLPLLSAALCITQKATGASLEHVALFFPVVLSAFISIPIWLYRNRIGGSLVAAVAIVFTLTSPAYVVRTKVGFLDTDCLIPFFMLMVSWLLHKSAEARGWRGNVYALAAGLVFKLFMMWYLKAAFYFLFVAVFVVLVALYRDTSRLGWPRWRDGLLKLAVFGLAGYEPGFRTDALLIWIKDYIGINIVQTQYTAGLPNIAMSVSELARQSLWIRIIQVHIAAFAFAAAAGFIWLLWARRRDAVSLLPLLGLGVLGLWSGMRYLIYLVPVAGIGFGFLVVRGTEALAEAVKKRRPVSVPAAAFGVAAVVSLVVVVFAPRKPQEYDPILNRPTVQGYLSMRQMERGLVWNPWDQGYPIQAITGQATYVDGGENNNAYYVSLSLMQREQKHMHNIIRNVLHAQTRLDRIRDRRDRNKTRRDRGWVETDIEKLRAEPQAGPGMPVYVTLTNDMIDKHRWINYFGGWDFKSASGDSEEKIWYMGSTMAGQPKGAFSVQRGNVDLTAGTVFFQKQLVLIRGVHRASELDPKLQSYTPYPFGQESHFIVELVGHATHTDVFLVNKDFYETQFNRMLILGDIDPSLFEVVYSNPMMTKVLRLK